MHCTAQLVSEGGRGFDFDDGSFLEAFGEKNVPPVLELSGMPRWVAVVVRLGLQLEVQRYAVVDPVQYLLGVSRLGPKAAAGAEVVLEAVGN